MMIAVFPLVRKTSYYYGKRILLPPKRSCRILLHYIYAIISHILQYVPDKYVLS